MMNSVNNTAPKYHDVQSSQTMSMLRLTYYVNVTSSFAKRLRGWTNDCLKMQMLVTFEPKQRKRIAGFARICPGDQFEMILKYGPQRWKSKCRVIQGQDQQWDQPTIVLNCLIGDTFEIKVSELKGFGKTSLVGDKNCVITDLYSAYPQLMSVSLNRTGSLKLNVLCTWNPMPKDLLNMNNPWSFGPRRQYAKSPVTVDKQANRRLSMYTLMSNQPAKKYPSMTDLRIDTSKPYALSANNTPKMLHQRNGNSFSETNSFLTHTKNNRKEAELSDYLLHIRTLAQRLLAEETELQYLMLYLQQIEKLLKPISTSPLEDRQKATLEKFDFLAEYHSDNDNDDLDDNVITNDSYGSTNGLEPESTILTDSRFPPFKDGVYPGSLLRNGRLPLSAAGSTHLSGAKTTHHGYSPHQKVKNNQRTKSANSSATSTGPSSVDSGFGSSSTMSTGSPELDVCLRHHLIHCDWLLKQFAHVGPLRTKQAEAKHRLLVESVAFSHILKLSRSPFALPSLSQVLLELKADSALEEVWRHALRGVGPHRLLYVPTELLQHALIERYGPIVKNKYPDLIDKVFDKLMHILSDSSNWSPDIITVFQMVLALREKHMPTVIESLAHETWIIQSICSGRTEAIRSVVERLKQVPVPPPPDCLRHLGVLLTAESKEHVQIAESYLLRAHGALREDLVNAFMTFLEDDSPRTRAGACRALSTLNARRSIGTIVFVYRNDSTGFVRDIAKESVLSFGAEGKELLDSARLSLNGFETIKI